ncbi:MULTISPECIES: outer membrane protein [Pseudorhizobium]|jgi:lipid A oxidase|uniref:outer membrane protein n=1 Tax=Pseudorhizobium TaxID=1903858 RepID=UPI0009DDF4BA|nr:outer membrane beta-barrel protein [Pseudorhizobium marinum]MBA4786302.1 porin family protein [Hyphomicrobiales bacterium]MBU1314136.1 outer membrane beta-barrel protein [Alphaproteobacteria bacterium]MDY6963850.1 outer membrane beta-barrel protein [Pseudomonadota bacterium]MBU1552488.1 outer membrane beta-barrel protein [Alphaproteobacteria bacterium]MBU2339481.1 outer membrane beta-barrel protein [Alphaproteobacteria bacterium]
MVSHDVTDRAPARRRGSPVLVLALAAGAGCSVPAVAADVAAEIAPVETTYVAPASPGYFELSAYGGYQTSPHSDIDVSDQASFSAGWEGKSFSTPPYWGVRGTYWFGEGQLSDLGVSLDFSHAKVYADDETLAKSGWSHFEMTDGINLLTLNALYRFPIEGTRFTPYIGAGAGINVPHIEVTRASGQTSEYQFGGATLQAQAGVKYDISDRWAAFVEYKGNYSWVDVDIDSGASLKTEVITNAVNLGVSFKF